MAELNVYISDVMKREMDYVAGVDWERIVHEAVWKKLTQAKKNKTIK
ncbi:MAG: hypothetical protein NTY48_07015 [Candidatus Diapherotrites archaeon]|nr:hypothetical protein [Candidatus Diapherotrites archaeon]